LAANSGGKNMSGSTFWETNIIGSNLCGKNMIGSTFREKNMIDSSFWEKKHDWQQILKKNI
jgi:uncharacterized protein YjbI with pentapeptide repeats